MSVWYSCITIPTRRVVSIVCEANHVGDRTGHKCEAQSCVCSTVRIILLTKKTRVLVDKAMVILGSSG